MSEALDYHTESRQSNALEMAGRWLTDRQEARVMSDTLTLVCVVCGEVLTDDEERRLSLDYDFVEHGAPGHLIRVERKNDE